MICTNQPRSILGGSELVKLFCEEVEAKPRLIPVEAHCCALKELLQKNSLFCNHSLVTQFLMH